MLYSFAAIDLGHTQYTAMPKQILGGKTQFFYLLKYVTYQYFLPQIRLHTPMQVFFINK